MHAWSTLQNHNNCSTSLELKQIKDICHFLDQEANQVEKRNKVENVRNYMCSQMLLDSRHNQLMHNKFALAKHLDCLTSFALKNNKYKVRS